MFFNHFASNHFALERVEFVAGCYHLDPGAEYFVVIVAVTFKKVRTGHSPRYMPWPFERSGVCLLTIDYASCHSNFGERPNTSEAPEMGKRRGGPTKAVF